MGPGTFGILGLETFTDPGILLMALAVALIPMIGGYMETSGQMNSLVSNLRVSRKTFLGSVPAMMGMLPMPGGALLSAPMVKQGGQGVSPEAKAALNVWFRHVIYLVYPISTALIVSTYLAGLTIYNAIPYLLPFFGLIIIVGYLFLLREGRGRITGSGDFSARGLLLPLSVLLAAPLIDFIILKTMAPGIREISLVIGVGTSFVMAAYLAQTDMKKSWKVARHMKPWNFGSIIFGMFLFLAIFQKSGVPELIGALGLSNLALCIGVGFLLGLVTGRIQVPASIIIPIYLGSAGVLMMNPWHFAITYVSIFMGYVISPVHPCVSVSLEYFDVELKKFLKRVAVPTAIIMIVMTAAGILLF
jgi:integral membrane protein (TIGR00529 family)